MKGTHIQIGAVLLAVIMTASVIGIGMAPVGAGLTGSDDADAQLTDTHIDDALLDANGESVEVIVQLENVDDEIVQAQGTDALQAHADATQEVVTDFAADTDGAEVINEFWITNAVVVELDTDKVDVEEIAALDGVQELTNNFDVQVPEEPDSVGTMDEDEIGTMDYTYGLEQINAPETWEAYDQGQNAKIAVLDTGVDDSHPDIDVADFAEFDEDGEIVSEDPRDSDQHGTHVSGTVAGGDDSGTAIGVAPQTELMHGLVLDGGQGSAGAILGGMEWAVEENADAISMSLGTEDYNDFFIDPVQNAEDAGTIVIAASGNSGEDTSGSPANVYDSMAIGATDSDEQVTDFSSGETIDTESAWGSEAQEDWPDEYIVPDVSAPGASVESAVPDGGYESFDGTSMATPHVSGVVALMVSAAEEEGVDYTVEDIKEALVDSTWKPDGESDGQDDRYGYGIVNAEDAVANLIGDGGEEPPEDPDESVTLDLGSAEGEQGDTVTLDLTAEGDAFAGYETTINFDADAVELTGVSGADMDDPVTNIDNDEGVVTMSQVSSSEESDLTLAQLEFEITADSEQTSEVSFEVDQTDVSDAQGTLLDVETNNGQIQVVEGDDGDDDYELGDVNGDGEINIADATLMQQYVVGEEPSNFNEEAADMDGDGEITTADVIEHLEFLVEN